MDMEIKDWLDGVETKLSEFEELGISVEALKEGYAAIEQKLASRSGDALAQVLTGGPSMGQQAAQSSDIAALCDELRRGGGAKRRAEVEIKAVITSATTNADGSAGALLVPARDELVPLLRRRLRIRDLLPVIQVSGNSVDVLFETGYTNNAAPVAEGATKPQSEMKFSLTNIPIRTLAHWVLASRQIVEDAPQLQGFIDSELRYGLDLAEDNQLLNGSGSGQDLNGIYTQATAFAAGSLIVPTPTYIDVIAAAILQVELTDTEVDGIVLHPSDWTRILLTKDAGGYYIAGDPISGKVVSASGPMGPTLYGRPVALSRAMTAGTFLVGDFAGGATLYDRWQTRVEVSTEDSDNFRKNLITILAEKRVGLAVKRTGSFVKGSFATAVTDLTS